VTTRRGAGDGDMRGGGHGDDRDAGDTNDELAGEDAKLRAMRSVWLSMRDEEPSSGGLAELMAAARGKAAEMAPPSAWWQRVVAGLRRPPVMAFATVLVLLGGAMIVGRQLERTGAPVAAGSASDALRTPPEVGGGTAPPARPAAPEAAGQVPRDPAAPPATAPPPPPAPAPAPAPAMDDASARQAGEAASATKAAGEANKPRSEPTGGDRPSATPARLALPRPTANAPVRGELDDDNGVSPGSEPPATPSAGAVAAPPNDLPATPVRPTTTRDEAEPPRAQHQTVAGPRQERGGATPSALYRQCEAAATRGDCAEVRRLVDQISTTDRRYRARVSRTSRIAKCLAE
jgi:hypothetical protein